jgi:hypothetical protein
MSAKIGIFYDKRKGLALQQTKKGGFKASPTFAILDHGFLSRWRFALP